jgi:hypothetical protein
MSNKKYRTKLKLVFWEKFHHILGACSMLNKVSDPLDSTELFEIFQNPVKD